MVVVAVVVALLAVGTRQAPATAPATTPAGTTPPTTPAVRVVKIGALAPLTGGLQSYGIGMRDAVLLAVEDANAACGAVKFEAVVEDTATDPTKALERLQILYGQGVRLVVGPMSSREVSAIKSFADGAGVILMSPSSTSPALAIAGDYLYRMVPTDLEGARVIVALLRELGVKRVAIAYRRDAWGEGVNRALREEAEKRGIAVVASEPYDPTPATYPVGIPAAIERLSRALGAPGPDAAAVFITFEDDGVVAAKSAAVDPVLSRVRWIGAEGMLTEGVVKQAGDVLARARLVAYIASPEPGDPNYRRFVERYRGRYGREPTGYDPYAYDSAMMLMQIVCQLGTDDVAKVKAALEQWGRSGRYIGVTGKVFLDENGDRTLSNYIIRGVKLINGTARWVDAAYYYGETDRIEVLDRHFFS